MYLRTFHNQKRTPLDVSITVGTYIVFRKQQTVVSIPKTPGMRTKKQPKILKIYINYHLGLLLHVYKPSGVRLFIP